MESNKADSGITLEQIVSLAQGLSPLEKLRVIERLAPDLEAALQSVQAAPQRRRSLCGMLRGCSISAEDIDEARREMWHDFPREDL